MLQFLLYYSIWHVSNVPNSLLYFLTNWQGSPLPLFSFSI
uniref:Uncharacterized protein n=1 Tax=Arundo donax TaxID=35708 RepID=A0A0A8YKK6_ARUDO